MPQYKTGDIWSQYGVEGSTILVTTNSIIAKGKLVMGAGAALHAKWKEPEIDTKFGRCVSKSCSLYGVLFNPVWDICAFQTKLDYWSSSRLNVIEFSTQKLLKIVKQYPDSIFNLCYPGIGFGRLTKDDVEPILSVLPDNVIVWSFD